MSSPGFNLAEVDDHAAMHGDQDGLCRFFMPISIQVLPAERDDEVSRETSASPFVRFDLLGVFSDGFLVVGVQGEEFDSHSDAGRRMHDFALNIQPVTIGKIESGPEPQIWVPRCHAKGPKCPPR